MCPLDTFLVAGGLLDQIPPYYFAIPLAVLIYLVNWTYCLICDQLQGYKDTDLASLKGLFLIECG